MAADTYKKEKELDKCARSVLIHNADKLVSAMEFEDNLGINYSLEDKVTKTLHKMCKSMISVKEVYTEGQGTYRRRAPPLQIIRTETVKTEPQ